MSPNAMPNLAIFWLTAALVVFAGWCITTAVIGITDEARKRWQTLAIFWTGTVLITIGCLAAILAASYGLMQLSLWVVR